MHKHITCRGITVRCIRSPLDSGRSLNLRHAPPHGVYKRITGCLLDRCTNRETDIACQNKQRQKLRRQTTLLALRAQCVRLLRHYREELSELNRKGFKRIAICGHISFNRLLVEFRSCLQGSHCLSVARLFAAVNHHEKLSILSRRGQA